MEFLLNNELLQTLFDAPRRPHVPRYSRSASARYAISAAVYRWSQTRLISSAFANTNLDLPAMPQDLYAITDDRSLHVIVDVGGDDRGALALGRLAPALLEENDYEMLLVVTRFRPLSRDAQSTIEIKQEIEAACGIPT